MINPNVSRWLHLSLALILSPIAMVMSAAPLRAARLAPSLPRQDSSPPEFSSPGGLPETQVRVAQIMPDKTLGSERSVVKGINRVKIQGGATRGANLFHSFKNFNIKTGQRVYFANPASVENILSRVTGSNQSKIDGLLGVDGSANFFLLNPNGVIFGPNARLDISGSFFTSTGSSFSFADGSEFKAAPTGNELLSMSVPLGVQFNHSAQGDITSTGRLETGQDLMLLGNELHLEGQLSAGRDLALLGEETVTVRDTATDAFVARAGGELSVQGNQGIDIWTLQHLDQPPFVSGGNLTLMSDGVISADAHFESGERFEIRSVSGKLANLRSLNDPIISSEEDVDIAANYSGASLLIESQKNVRVQGDIDITTEDTTDPSPFIGDDEVLGQSAGLIIRSGQETLTYVDPKQNAQPPYTMPPFDTIAPPAASPVPSGITLSGDVTTAGGPVKLKAETGDISVKGIASNGGNIQLESVLGNITTQADLNTRNGGNDGGNITLSSSGDIITNGRLNSYSYTIADNAGDGGDITITSSSGNITTNEKLDSVSRSDNGDAGDGGNINIESTSSTLSTSSISGNITTNGNLTSYSYTIEGDAGQGGDITIKSKSGNIITTNRESDPKDLRYLDSVSRSVKGNAGDGGNISISSSSGNITTNGILRSFSFSQANNRTARDGGDITISSISGNITNGNGQSFSYSDRGNAGEGGNISISSESGKIKTSDLLFSSSFSGQKNAKKAGNIDLRAQEISGNETRLAAFSIAQNGKSKAGGKVELAAKTISSLEVSTFSNSKKSGQVIFEGIGNSIAVSNLSLTTSLQRGEIPSIPFSNRKISQVRGSGQAGNIFIKSAGSLNLNNVDIRSNSNTDTPAGRIEITSQGPIILLNSQIRSNANRTSAAGDIKISTEPGNNITLKSDTQLPGKRSVISASTRGGGDGGNITLISDLIELDTKSSISASTKGSGDGGNITLISKGIRLDGIGRKISASTTGSGRGGNIILKSDLIELDNGSVVSASTQGEKKPVGGKIIIDSNLISLDNNSRISASTLGKGKGGDILIKNSDLIKVSDKDSRISASTSGRGKGGKITLDSNKIEFDNNGKILAETTGPGNGGDIIFTPSNKTLSITGQGEISVKAQYVLGMGNTDSDKVGNAGTLTIKAPNAVNVDQANLSASTEGNVVDVDGKFNGGQINIDTKTLNVRNGGQILASTLGEGKGGNINLNTDTITVQKNDDNSQIEAATSGRGDGGNIIFNLSKLSETLNITGDGEISVKAKSSDSNDPVGNAGTLRINAKNADVAVDQAKLSASTEAKVVDNNGRGNGGRINIDAKALSVTNGGQISAATSGRGKGGNITLNTDTITVEKKEDLSPIEVSNAQIEASTSGSGTGGNIIFKSSDTLNIAGNGEISVETSGEGTAGSFSDANNFQEGKSIVEIPNITIDNATLSASTNGPEKGGDIAITTDKLSLLNGGEISASAKKESTGDGGNIILNTDQINFGNNSQEKDSQISASTSGKGKGGTISLNSASKKLNITGKGKINVETDSTFDTADAGDLIIKAQKGLVVNEAQLSASTTKESTGDGGDITLSNDQINFENNGQIVASTSGGGPGGNIIFNPSNGTLKITGDGVLSVETSEAGAAGTFSDADNIETGLVEIGEISINQATLSASTSGSEKGGDIKITTDKLSVLNGGEISTSTTKDAGTGGTITLNTGTVNLENNGKIIAETSGKGTGGTLIFNTSGTALNITGDGELSVKAKSDSQVGNAGELIINAPNAVVRIDQANLSASTEGDVVESDNLTPLNTNNANEMILQGNNAGQININAKTLRIKDGGQISASTSGEGKGGNIMLNTDTITLEKKGNVSQIEASTSGSGDGGNISFNPSGKILNIIGDGELSVKAKSDSQGGNAGELIINAPNAVVRIDQANLSASTEGAGLGGGITLNTDQIRFQNDGRIEASTSGPGNGGNIIFNPSGDTLSLFGDGVISVETSGKGKAGTFSDAKSAMDKSPSLEIPNITINQAKLNASTTGPEKGGDINIKTNQLRVINGGEISVSTDKGTGDSGNLTLSTDQIRLIQKGRIEASTSGEGRGGNIEIRTDQISFDKNKQSQISASTSGEGKGGNLTVSNNGLLTLKGRGKLTVESTEQRSGPAGNLTINAKKLGLRDGVELAADTNSRNGGGNIDIDTDLSIFLSGESLINAISKNSDSNSAGGGDINITIKKGFLIAKPGEDNDILANAVGGKGGKIKITALRILGFTNPTGQDNRSIQELQNNNTSDISASSEFDTDGVVNLINLALDPAQGLSELPTNLEDPANRIARSCRPEDRRGPNTPKGDFTITGPGGQPLRPSDLAEGETPLEDLGPTLTTPEEASHNVNAPPPSSPSRQLADAQQAVVTETGEVFLIAQEERRPSVSCSALSQSQ